MCKSQCENENAFLEPSESDIENVKSNDIEGMDLFFIFMYNYNVLFYIFDYRVRLIKILLFNIKWTYT